MSSYKFESNMSKIKELIENSYNLLPDHEKARAINGWYKEIICSVDSKIKLKSHQMKDSLASFDNENID